MHACMPHMPACRTCIPACRTCIPACRTCIPACHTCMHACRTCIFYSSPAGLAEVSSSESTFLLKNKVPLSSSLAWALWSEGEVAICLSITPPLNEWLAFAFPCLAWLANKVGSLSLQHFFTLRRTNFYSGLFSLSLDKSCLVSTSLV